MSEFDFGMKELYSVKLKATSPMNVGNLFFESGEVITEFDSVQIANFQEVKSIVMARGGKGNPAQIIWDDVKEVPFTFARGIFNKLQFAILNNANIVEKKKREILLTATEICESNEILQFSLKHKPIGKVFARNYETNERVSAFKVDENLFQTEKPFLKMFISYEYEYENKATELVIGKRFFDGFLSLEAKTRVKDDITGQTHTGIIKIPKLKLMSDLSMRLGEMAGPQVGEFYAVGYPVGSKGDKKVLDILFLEDDIDSDM